MNIENFAPTEYTMLTLEDVRQSRRKLYEQIRIVQQDLRCLQRHCPHDYLYHPDPSGNNDSFYECTACGHVKSRT